MKKKMFFIGCLIIALFTQCEKASYQDYELESTFESPKSSEPTYKKEWDLFQVKPNIAKGLIQDFTKTTTASSSRSDEKMAIEKAIWYIEALSNSKHGHANFNYSKLELHQFKLPLAVSLEKDEALVSEAEVKRKIEAISDLVLKTIDSGEAKGIKKKVKVIDVSPFSNGEKNPILKITIGIGWEILACDNCAEPWTFNCEDTINCWSALGNVGTCNTPPSGPTTGNAAELIQDIINSQNEEWGCQLMPNSYGAAHQGYFINIVPEYEIFYNNHPNPNDLVADGYRDYLLFYTESGTNYGYNSCLTPNETLFYRNGTIDVIQNRLFYNPNFSGKDFVMCDLTATLWLGGIPNAFHLLDIFAGDFSN